jgi:hypothetical protein
MLHNKHVAYYGGSKKKILPKGFHFTFIETFLLHKIKIQFFGDKIHSGSHYLSATLIYLIKFYVISTT